MIMFLSKCHWRSSQIEWKLRKKIKLILLSKCILLNYWTIHMHTYVHIWRHIVCVYICLCVICMHGVYQLYDIIKSYFINSISVFIKWMLLLLHHRVIMKMKIKMPLCISNAKHSALFIEITHKVSIPFSPFLPFFFVSYL